MDIENVSVRHVQLGSFTGMKNEGDKHVKALPYLSIVQATEGFYSFGLNNAPMKDMQEGECFIAPSFARQEIVHHVNAESKAMSGRWIFMDVSINADVSFDMVFVLPIFPSKEICEKISKIFDEMFSTADIIDRKIGCYQLLKLLLPLADPAQKINQKVIEVVSYMQRNFKKRLTVQELADMAYVSSPNLYRLFQEYVGVSPIAYLNGLKLSHASVLLERSNRSVGEIAEECGIEDAFYFSKLFKRKYGCSPLQYRKRVTGKVE